MLACQYVHISIIIFLGLYKLIRGQDIVDNFFAMLLYRFFPWRPFWLDIGHWTSRGSMMFTLSTTRGLRVSSRDSDEFDESVG